MKKVKTNNAEIIRLWDEIAPSRSNQILSGADKTYNFFIMPTIHRLVEEENLSGNKILDYGCGVGAISKRLHQDFHYTGIDVSSKFINIAKENFSRYGNFMQIDTRGYPIRSLKNKFDTILSILVMMDVYDLASYLRNSRSMMNNNGSFIFCMTHPCFWPVYAGYDSASWYCYKDEIAIRNSFKTSTGGNLDQETIHFHRPLENILSCIRNAGLRIEKLLEPSSVGSDGVNVPPQMPRFLFGIAKAIE